MRVQCQNRTTRRIGGRLCRTVQLVEACALAGQYNRPGWGLKTKKIQQTADTGAQMYSCMREVEGWRGRRGNGREAVCTKRAATSSQVMGHTWNSPCRHLVTGSHRRSALAVGARASYSASVHTVYGTQTASAMAVGATSSYWPLGHTVCATHSRLLVAVGGTSSYSPDAQAVMAAHSRLRVADGARVCEACVVPAQSGAGPRHDVC